MEYTKEEIKKALKISRELDAEFWEKCANHVKEAVGGLIGSTYCSKITINGSWCFTIGGSERSFIGDAVVEIDNGVEVGFIKRIAFYSQFHDGLQKETTFTQG